jgi:site-specific DNA-methyltransferase (adenine-specific)
MSVEILNIDCMEYMRKQPDKSFDLAIVDPPYGIGAGSVSFKNGSSKSEKLYFKDKGKDWDKSPPSSDYFNELRRVSINQIIWGGNYFLDHLGSTRCMVFWDKTIHGNSYADGELAWTSFNMNVRCFRENIVRTTLEGRIHPTQKSIKLYEWLLVNYAKPGQRIIDTHLGSGSSAIAAHNFGVNFVGCELDLDYYNAATKRFKQHTAQLTIFNS